MTGIELDFAVFPVQIVEENMLYKFNNNYYTKFGPVIKK